MNLSFVNSLLALYKALVRSVIEYGSDIWSPYTTVDIYRIDRVQNFFFVSYCLNIPHAPPDYRNVSQVLRLDSLSTRCNNFGITFIQHLIEGQIDTPRILGELSFCIPGNTSFRVLSIRLSINLASPSRNAPLLRMMHNLNTFIEY